MIIYWSMLGWIILWGGVFCMLQQQYRLKRPPMFFVVITYGYLTFWIGMRSGFADTGTYISIFNSMPDKLSLYFENYEFQDAKSVGYELLQVVFKQFISQDYHLWLMLIALISIICIVYVIYNESERFFLSSYFFITMLIFMWLLNGMRQFLAVSVLFASYKLIIKQRTWSYMILIILMSTIHFSCLLMIPVYFVVQLKPFKLNTVAIISVLILLCIFANPVISRLEILLEGTAYGGFSSQFSSDDGVNPIRVIVAFIPVIIAFWKRKKVFNDNNRFIEIAANMSLISAGLYMFGIFTSGIIIGRLPIYCEVYNIIFLPYVLKKGFEGRERIFMEISAVCGYLAYFYLQSGGWYYVSEFTGIIN